MERLSLGDDGMLMCASRVFSELVEALDLVARPGYKTYESGQAHGAPAGWHLLTGVQLAAQLPAVRPSTGTKWSDELQAVSALSASQLVLSGGLRLPGRLRRWLSSVPPELTAVAGDGDSLKLAIEDEGGTEVHVLGGNGPALIWDLGSLGLPDGAYEVSLEVVSGGKAAGSSARLRLRSPDSPAPPQAAERLARSTASAFSMALSAGRELEGVARGAIADAPEAPEGTEAPSVTPGWVAGRAGHAAPTSAGGPSRLSLPELGQPGCFTTGAHVLQYPTFHGRATSKWVVGRCRHCGLVRRSPATASGAKKKAQRQPTAPVRFEKPVLPAVTERKINEDEAFAALCTLREGSAGWFEQVALQVEPSSLFVDVLLRGLEVLAHIEVERSARSLAPTHFEVTEPAACRGTDGSLFLVGWRSPRLLAAVAKATAELGGSLETVPQPTAPATLRLSGVQAADLCEAVAAHGFRLLDGADAGLRIAAALPKFSTLFDELPVQPIASYRTANRWDHTVARWLPTTDLSSPGAYQLHGMTTTYVLRTPQDVTEGTARRADARTVKHLAGVWTGTPLVGYDADQNLLYVPRGADLPGLYGRAAVLCSGLLPTVVQAENLGGESGATPVLAYSGVTPDVAHLIMEAMSS